MIDLLFVPCAACDLLLFCMASDGFTFKTRMFKELCIIGAGVLHAWKIPLHWSGLDGKQGGNVPSKYARRQISLLYDFKEAVDGRHQALSADVGRRGCCC